MTFSPRDTFLLTLVTTVLLAGASHFTPVGDGVLGLHKVDLFSELRSDSVLSQTAEGDNFTVVRQPSPSPQVPQMVIKRPEQSGKLPVIAPAAAGAIVVDSVAVEVVPDSVQMEVKPRREAVANKNVTAIQEFASREQMTVFCDKLKNVNSMGRPIRIAVLGDSFIEGDIFTQDLREMLQSRFGGNGVGFVPMASAVAGFRQTVSHSFSGWATHCITSNLRKGGYVISSYTFTPSQGNMVQYRGSKARAHLSNFSRARLLFINRGNSTIHSSVNGAAEQVFTPASGEELQQMVLIGDSIHSVRFSINSPEGFTGYGAFLDAARGVSVDNYSVRGNSGITLSSTDMGLMQQMNSMLPYDLIIFEYGLNVAQADVRSYKTYLAQMQVAIAHLKRSFPQSALLIMSVPDRARRTSDGLSTMPGIEAMAETQRLLAEKSGVAYWSTLAAMRARGGMGEFVKKGWAAKDYTHLSHRGGKELARAFFDALMLRVDEQ